MHQNTTFYAKLNAEHAGEGFMPLRSIVLEIWTRKTKKSWNFRKFDLWPVITGSNMDLGPKIIPPIVSTRREQSAGLFREALPRFVWKRQGGGSHPPTPAKVAKHGLWARVKGLSGLVISAFVPASHDWAKYTCIAKIGIWGLEKMRRYPP